MQTKCCQERLNQPLWKVLSCPPFLPCVLPTSKMPQVPHPPAILKFVLNTSTAAYWQPAAPKCWKPCKPSTTLLLFEVCLEHFISCMLPGCSPKMLAGSPPCYFLKVVLNTSTAACCQPAVPKCQKPASLLLPCYFEVCLEHFISCMLAACRRRPKMLEALQAFYYPAIFEVCLEHFISCMLPACSPKMLEALQAFYYRAVFEVCLCITSPAACCQPAAPKCWKPSKPSSTLLFLKFVLNTSTAACCQPAAPKFWKPCKPFTALLLLKFVLNTSLAACCQPAAPKFWKPCKPSTTLLFLKFVLHTSLAACCQAATPKFWKPCTPFTALLFLKFVLNTSLAACCQAAAPKVWKPCKPSTTLLFLKFVLNTSTAACCQPAAPKFWKPCKPSTTLLLGSLASKLNLLHVASLQPQNAGSPASLLLPCHF